MDALHGALSPNDSDCVREPQCRQLMELRAQQAEAVASGQLLWISLAQLVLSIIGTVFVVGALILNWRAVNAATDQARTQREHLERFETPFLRVVPVQPRATGTSTKPFNWVNETTLVLENCGRSYALVTNFSAETVHSLRRGGYIDPRKTWGLFVGNALVVPVDRPSIALAASAPAVIDEAYQLMEEHGGVVRGIVRYKDALGCRYVLGFAFSYSTHRRDYLQVVDPRANFHFREADMPFPSSV